jgi:hypothetical protein
VVLSPFDLLGVLKNRMVSEVVLAQFLGLSQVVTVMKTGEAKTTTISQESNSKGPMLR